MEAELHIKREENIIEENNNAKREERPIIFKEKRFEARESMLSDDILNTDMRVAFNLFSAVFILFFLRAMIDDIFVHGIPFYHLWLVAWNFKYLPATLFVWTIMFLSTFIPFGVFKLWAHTPKKNVKFNTELGVFSLYISYLVLFFYFPLRFLFKWELNCACSFIITCETTRIAMKVHSFIRENMSRAIEKKTNGDIIQAGCDSDWPSVDQFVYFMFCPSFIYRDFYPRSETRCNKRVAFYFLQCFILIEFVNLSFTQYVFPWLDQLEYTKLSFSSIVMSLFSAILPGVICLICLFFGLLHCWLNAFSEMMRFADRQFYLNWWNAENMAEYYRNWNLVVHDWLYAYVFRDVAMLIGGRRGLRVSQLCVFFLSAVFHEYWFGIAFRVFYPVMFLLYFVFGGIFFFVSRLIKNKSIWNTALWFNLLIGTGMFVAFYGQEWYARTRCAPYSSSIADFLLPRHWNCHPIKV